MLQCGWWVLPNDREEQRKESSAMEDLLMQTLELSDGTVYYRKAGQGPPLLLLHGWAGSSRYWQPTLNALADMRTSYAPDLPGYGASPPLNRPATPETMTHLIIAFADALGMEQFDLNAHSLSSVMAMTIAVRWPERVRRIVLTCAGTYKNEKNRKTVERVHRIMEVWLSLRHPRMASIRPLYRTVARRFFHRVPEDDELLRQSFADFLKMDKRTALETSRNSVDPQYNVLLTHVAAPTLVIGARQDRLMPHYGPPMLARLVPDSRLIWIDQCGHLPMIECPQLYHDLVRKFLLEQDHELPTVVSAAAAMGGAEAILPTHGQVPEQGVVP